MDEGESLSVKAGEDGVLPQDKDLKIYFLKPINRHSQPVPVQNYGPLVGTVHGPIQEIQDFWVSNFGPREIEVEFSSNNLVLSQVKVLPDPKSRFIKVNFFQDPFPLSAMNGTPCYIHVRDGPRTLPFFYRYREYPRDKPLTSSGSGGIGVWTQKAHNLNQPKYIKTTEGRTLIIHLGVVEISYCSKPDPEGLLKGSKGLSVILKEVGNAIYQRAKLPEDKVQFIFDPSEAPHYIQAITSLGFTRYNVISDIHQTTLIIRGDSPTNLE